MGSCEQTSVKQKNQNNNYPPNLSQKQNNTFLSNQKNNNINIVPLKQINSTSIFPTKIYQKNTNNIILSQNCTCNCILCSEKNLDIKIAKMFLINDCNITLGELDKAGDLTREFIGWRENSQNGPPGFLKKFIPPKGWTAIGLKVLNKYDNGDNTWLGTSNTPGEWYVGYHGIKDKDAISGIIRNGFIIGPRQQYMDSYNKNPLTYFSYMCCEKGAYFTPDINDAQSYTGIINYNQYNLRIVFMCRINPIRVKIADIGEYREYWLTNGTTDEVRPYRILFKFENNII